MRLYRVRHCDAVHPTEHPDRPLSVHGRQQAARLRDWLDATDVRVDEVLHSGVLRAKQTAETLAAAVRPARGVRMVPGLRPGDPARDAADTLRCGDESRLVVTHLPIVAHIASLLLAGSEHGEPLSFATGTIAALVGEGDHWSLDWLMRPELLPER